MRYRPPWLWVVVGAFGFLVTRLPPRIWLDEVLLVLSVALWAAVVVHAALWVVAWAWLNVVHKS